MCGSSSVVECHLAKVDVASPNLVYRSTRCHSQVVRRRSAKPLFPGPNPGGTSTLSLKWVIVQTSSVKGDAKGHVLKRTWSFALCFFGWRRGTLFKQRFFIRIFTVVFTAEVCFDKQDRMLSKPAAVWMMIRWISIVYIRLYPLSDVVSLSTSV